MDLERFVHRADVGIQTQVHADLSADANRYHRMDVAVRHQDYRPK